MKTEQEIREKFNHYEYVRWDNLRNTTDYANGFADALNISECEGNDE